MSPRGTVRWCNRQVAMMERQQEVRSLTLDALRVAPPTALLLAPLDYIHAEHFRQRALCKALEEIAEASECDGEILAAAVDFLKGDFGTHIVDEEQDLFPLLRRRATPEDDIGELLGSLSNDHGAEVRDADVIVTRVCGPGMAWPPAGIEPEYRDLLRRFSRNERRHLSYENAIVLPLARLRLTPDDLRNLGRRMAARRGLDYPETPNAH